MFNVKFQAQTIATSKIDGGKIDVVDVYQVGSIVEYKIRWTENGRNFESYVAASEIDAEFEIDREGTKFVYHH